MKGLSDLFDHMSHRYLVGDWPAATAERDLRDFFSRLSTRYLDKALEEKKRIFKSNNLILDLGGCLTWAPVREASGLFEIDAAPRPSPKAWRWIIAVRSGLWDMRPVFDGRGLADEQKQALLGHTVWDLFACDRDLKRVTARFSGLSAVAGWPVFPELATRPVHVHETPLSWLLSRCHGVVLSGDRLDDQAWLHGCAPGVVAARLPMAEALRTKMRRPVVDHPPVFVDA